MANKRKLTLQDYFSKTRRTIHPKERWGQIKKNLPQQIAKSNANLADWHLAAGKLWQKHKMPNSGWTNASRQRYGYRRQKIPLSAATHQHYGASRKLATNAQMQSRDADGYYGPGRYHRRRRTTHRRRRIGHRRRGYGYRGRGGFFGKLWGGVKKYAAPIAMGVADRYTGGLASKLVGGYGSNPTAGSFPTARTFTSALRSGLSNFAANSMPQQPYNDSSFQDDFNDLGDGGDEMDGMGDYGPVNSNAIVTGVPGNAAGIVSHSAEVSNMDGSGDITLSHKEFVQNVVIQCIQAGQAQSTFTNQAFPLNPGLQATFPFLSQIAQNFTLYSMQGIMFQYKPTSGEMGVNSQQLGKVIMATDYDPLAVPFINSVQMENYQFSNSAKPSIGQIHGIECKPSESLLDMKYVRTGTTTRDKALTDIGLFQLATEGIPFPLSAKVGDTLVIGELWATYTIKVSRANLYSSLLAYNVFTYQQRCNVQAAPTDTRYLSSPGTQPKPMALTSIFAPSNNYGVTFNIYQAAQDNQQTVIVPLTSTIVLTWPQNTILGTFMIEVDCHFTQTTDDTSHRYLIVDETSPVSTVTIPGVTNTTTAYPNSANLLTQWGRPFDGTNFNAQGLLFPPSIGITGLPIKPSNKITDYMGPSGGNWTAAGSSGSYIQNDLPGGILPPYQGFTFKCGFSINAPGLNTAQLVLSLQGIAGSAQNVFYPTDLFRVRVTSTNSSITQAYPGN